MGLPEDRRYRRVQIGTGSDVDRHDDAHGRTGWCRRRKIGIAEAIGEARPRFVGSDHIAPGLAAYLLSQGAQAPPQRAHESILVRTVVGEQPPAQAPFHGVDLLLAPQQGGQNLRVVGGRL